MCGIAGILAPSKIKKDIFLKNLQLMSTSMGRRGPDNQGLWLDNNLKFGCMHNRLSIIDLSSSANQPMISSDQRYVLSYNGEIYNHLKIRREIQEEIFGDLNWKTTSDTETLLKAIEIWGLEDTLNRICGMFAFSIWDRKNLTLSLARDRFGEKPLYWGLVKDKNICNDPSFIYASDISAFENFVYAKNIPARDVSGDYFDVMKVGPEEYYFTLADVSGKGVKAGMYMAKASSIFRTLSNLKFPLERVVFGGGDTNEVLEDCGLLEVEDEVTAEAVETSS